LSDGQSINGIVVSVGTDKLHEHDLPAEVECGDQSVVSSSDFKAGTITIEHLGFRRGAANVVHRVPIRGLYQLIPTVKRDFRFGMHAGIGQENVSGIPHCGNKSKIERACQIGSATGAPGIHKAANPFILDRTVAVRPERALIFS
jgi:hypothetical protein